MGTFDSIGGEVKPEVEAGPKPLIPSLAPVIIVCVMFGAVVGSALNTFFGAGELVMYICLLCGMVAGLSIDLRITLGQIESLTEILTLYEITARVGNNIIDNITGGAK